MKSLEEITEEVIQLYKEDKDLDEIAKLVDAPRYLVESILVSEYRIYFR